MQPPRFWYEASGRDEAPLLRALLEPVSWAYAAAGAHRLRTARPARAPGPVVCIGNVTVGGAGKTPVARAARAVLAAQGVRADTLSRGYGGRLAGPLRVDADAHAAADVGDEPLLHARDGAAWIARDRLAGARAAFGDGAQLLLMDDGFQNPSLAKDLSLLVFDADAGVGNGKVFPAGPLREPLAAGLARADAIVLLHGRACSTRPDWLPPSAAPTLHAWLMPSAPPPDGPLLAFAGIGRPGKFFDTLRAHGGDLRDGVAFPDHHPYKARDLERVADLARRHNARLVTTEKDAVRLPPALRPDVAVFAVSASFAEPDAFRAVLLRAMSPR